MFDTPPKEPEKNPVKFVFVMLAVFFIIGLLGSLLRGERRKPMPESTGDQGYSTVLTEHEGIAEDAVTAASIEDNIFEEGESEPLKQEYHDIVSEMEGVETVETTSPLASSNEIEEAPFAKAIRELRERETEVDPYITMSPVPRDIIEEVAESYSRNRPLLSNFKEIVVEGSRWTEWNKNYLGALVDFNQVLLHFDHQNPLDLTKSESQFQLRLIFNERRIVIDVGAVQSGPLRDAQRRKIGHTLTLVHNRPKLAVQAGGYRMPLFTENEVKAVIPGLGRSGVVSFVPIQPAKGVRGVLICPRDYKLWSVTAGFHKLEETPYKLTKVAFAPEVIVDNRVTTGFGPGIARSSIQATRGLPEPRQVVDFQIGKFPESRLHYSPRLSKLRWQRYNSEQGSHAGLLVNLVTHNSLQHYSESSVEARVGVYPARLSRGETLKIDENTFEMTPGPCVAVVKHWEVRHRFRKYELPLPLEAFQ